MDTQSATVIQLDQHRCTQNWGSAGRGSLIWDALERNERHVYAPNNAFPTDEVTALRAALLDHWAELHHLKCHCDLSVGVECRAPLPPELGAWIDAQRPDQKTV